MGVLEKVTRIQTYQADEPSQGACNQPILFSAVAGTLDTNLSQPLLSCVNAICSPRTPNPDLRGIGVRSLRKLVLPMLTVTKVFISLLMQLSLAMVISIALSTLKFRPTHKQKREKSHIDALSVALVDFHRSQCYFIAAIQIASFVLDSQAYRDYERSIPSPIFDVLLSIPLSLNGLVPTVFTLCSISEFGHLSWHVIILSILCIVLSTGSLITTYIWILIIDKNTNQDTLGEIAGGFDYASTLETARSAPNRET